MFSFYVLLGILVLVKGKEPSLFIQPLQYLAAVSSTSERYIHIYTVWLDIQTVNTLLEQHRYVVCLFLQFYLFLV